MSKFLKLSNTIINTHFIREIRIYQSQIYIGYNNNSINGFNFFSFGLIKSNDDGFTIFKENAPHDYDIVKKWIDTI